MKNTHFSASDILAQLDTCAKDFNFPVLDNGFIYPVVSRLSVFGDAEHWIIAIEAVGYHYRFHGHSGVENCFYIYGNRLPSPPGMNYDNGLWVTDDSKEGPSFLDDTFGTLNPAVGSMLIRDAEVSIPKDPAFYTARGVELENPDTIRVYEFMRACLPEIKPALLAEDDELYDAFRQDLPKLLQLDEWFHPDVALEEKPSENETFQLIAAVLEAGDASLYQPVNKPNNQWRNWPVGGTL